MKNTKIEWADATWNPVTGCKNNCPYCYARRIAERFGGYDSRYTAQSAALIADDAFDNPELVETWDDLFFEQWSKKDPDGRPAKGAILKLAPYPYGFTPTLHRHRLKQPKVWHEPKNIFVCSMADLFGDWVPDKWIEEVFEACDAAPQHNYIFLTKNPRRLGKMAEAGTLPERKNFWYGSTITDGKSGRYPGRGLVDNTFVSIEPLLEYLDVGIGSFGFDKWIIIGAETGNRKEKVTPKREWIEKICDAAALTRAAVFMKDSLIPIMGEENMIRELPAGLQHKGGCAG